MRQLSYGKNKERKIKTNEYGIIRNKEKIK